MPFIRARDRNVLFIHIPRTGGTTVEHWMRQVGDLRLFSYSLPAFTKVTPQHLRYADVCELLGDNYFDYAFTIVRSPFERLASEFRLRAKLANEGVWKGVPRFSTWFETQLDAYSRNPMVLDNHIRPQWEFVSDTVKVFKYEDGLSPALASVAKELGVPAPTALERKLDTSDVEAPVKFDVPDIERATAFYARDFELFGYNKARKA